MLQVSIVGGAHARPEELRKRLGGHFDIAFTRLEEIEGSVPGQYILFDVDLSDPSLIIKIKD